MSSVNNPVDKIDSTDQVLTIENLLADKAIEKNIFRLVVDAVPTGIVMVDKDGIIVLTNPHLLNLFAYTEQELIGQPIEILLPERMRSAHPGKIKAFFTAPTKRAMGSDLELYAERSDRSEFPVEIGLTPLNTEEGQFVLATIVDITERKQAEKILARNRDQLNTVVEAAPTGIVMIDENARITLVNYQIEQLFGYSRDDLIGQPIEMLLPVRMRATHPEKVKAFFTSPSSRSMGAGRDLFAARFDGTEFPVEIGLSPIELHDGPQVLATIVDMTKRKEQELRLQRANEGLEQFVYVASHDLRSPLRGISDLLEWIKEDLEETPNPNITVNIDRAALRVARLERLIIDLLSYARAGAVDEVILEYKPQDMIQEILDIQPLPAGIKIKLVVPDCVINAVKTPIETVLRNLISNAIKHHDLDKGVITIGVVPNSKNIEFYVSDDGPGIATRVQTRIFKLFQTAGSTETKSSGVGLAVSKRLVEAHGGWIVVESEDNKRGTTFRFFWPLTQE